jgi:uncharacterized protein YhbP (UPF0306 family)
MQLLAHGDWPPDIIRESITEILREVHLCTLATVGPEGNAHAAPLFFAVAGELGLIFLTKPGTKHGQNIRLNPVCVITIFDSHQGWGTALRGLRLFGRATRLEGEAAEEGGMLYVQRFPTYEDRLGGLDIEHRFGFGAEFFLFYPDRVELMDETRFPKEPYVGVHIIRG